MRRRIRSAAFPVHRHALPQLLVDGASGRARILPCLLAALRGRLQRPNHRYGHLLERHDRRASWWSRWSRWRRSASTSGCGGSSASATTRRCSRPWSWRRSVIVGVIALLHPVRRPTSHTVIVRHFGRHHQRPVRGADQSAPGPASAVTLPASVIMLFFLLSLALLVGARFAVQLIAEGRDPQHPRRQGRP